MIKISYSNQTKNYYIQTNKGFFEGFTSKGLPRYGPVTHAKPFASLLLATAQAELLELVKD